MLYNLNWGFMAYAMLSENEYYITQFLREFFYAYRAAWKFVHPFQNLQNILTK